VDISHFYIPELAVLAHKKTPGNVRVAECGGIASMITKTIDYSKHIFHFRILSTATEVSLRLDRLGIAIHHFGAGRFVLPIPLESVLAEAVLWRNSDLSKPDNAPSIH